MTHPKLDPDGCFRPQRMKIYAWQVGPALLAASVLCMVVGMAIMLWVGTGVGPYKTQHEDWWQSNAKVSQRPYHTHF